MLRVIRARLARFVSFDLPLVALYRQPAAEIAADVSPTRLEQEPARLELVARVKRFVYARLDVENRVAQLVLRVVEPDRPRPFRVPFVWPIALAGAAACIFIMRGLPVQAWERFGIWLGIGLVIYVVYGYRHSALRGTASNA